MATTWWTGNAIATTQVSTITVTAVAIAGTLTATINGKNITYTCITGDTIASAATAWFALLSASTAPPEFQELSFTNPSDGVIVIEAQTPGTPFTLTKSQAGGATATLTLTTANSSPSDVGIAANWLRAGSPGLPQNNDDVIVADSSVPLLWNLTALAAVVFATYTRWQSFTGTVGLPENNPNGYLEYRPTYFQFATAAGGSTITLGFGQTGSGPTRERYDVGTTKAFFVVIAAGSPADDFAIRLLGTNVDNTLAAQGTSIGVAMLPGETASLTAAYVYNGGAVSFGVGCTIAGVGSQTLTINNGSVNANNAFPTINAANGSSLTVGTLGTTFTTISAISGSTITWRSSASISTLSLKTGSTFDKSQDNRSITITNSNVEVDTCQVLDPLNAITWTNATTANNASTTGAFQFGAGRTVKIA